MESIQLFELASRKSAWLAARQATLAGNVANADTPGYRAKDIAPFADVLAKTELRMAATSGTSVVPDGSDAGGVGTRSEANVFDVSETGNTVGIETEMIKAGEVNRDFAMTTNIVKSFHAMLMASLKG